MQPPRPCGSRGTGRLGPSSNRCKVVRPWAPGAVRGLWEGGQCFLVQWEAPQPRRKGLGWLLYPVRPITQAEWHVKVTVPQSKITWYFYFMYKGGDLDSNEVGPWVSQLELEPRFLTFFLLFSTFSNPVCLLFSHTLNTYPQQCFTLRQTSSLYLVNTVNCRFPVWPVKGSQDWG